MESIFESLENLNVSEECFEDIVGLVEMYLSEGYNLRDTVRNIQVKAYDEVQKERGKDSPQYKIYNKLKDLAQNYANRTGKKDDHYLGDNLERAAMNQKSDSDVYNNKLYQPGYGLTRGKDLDKELSKNQKGDWETKVRRAKKYMNK